VPPEPVRPRPPDGRRQDELVEELAHLIRVDVVADVVLRPLAEDLLVNSGARSARSFRSYVIGGPLQRT
jgi:hypothetical protein